MAVRRNTLAVVEIAAKGDDRLRQRLETRDFGAGPDDGLAGLRHYLSDYRKTAARDNGKMNQNNKRMEETSA
jgi:hypothetical protein